MMGSDDSAGTESGSSAAPKPPAEAATSDPGDRADRPQRAPRAPGWRWLTPVVCLLCGAMFPISAANSEGSDLRPGRYTELSSLASAQRRQVDRLTRRTTQLQQEIDTITAQIADARVRAAQRKAAGLEPAAGLSEINGEGLRVVLSDAPPEIRADFDGADPNWLVVHQQDIQAVVNALWEGGAEAVTVQGQRIVTTTGIRCEGSLVLLQGRPYAQPYVIEAVGDPEALEAAIDADNLLNVYRAQADDPEIQIGWELIRSAEVTAPAYDGVLANRFASPIVPSDAD